MAVGLKKLAHTTRRPVLLLAELLTSLSLIQRCRRTSYQKDCLTYVLLANERDEPVNCTMKPIPDNVKAILGSLPGPQQVALRTYIASLRSEITEFETEAIATTDPDPHAHYHGHDKVSARDVSPMVAALLHLLSSSPLVAVL
jgi:hypothetical protein